MTAGNSSKSFIKVSRVPAVIVAIVLAAAAQLACGSKAADASANAGASGPSGKTGATGGTGRTIPVQTSPVEQKDVPIWIEGLGSVIAYQQVLVKTQVDGRLDTVDFKEGDPVKKGQVLAQIDPRPFQVQLHTAEGQLKRDQAAVHDAQLNLDRNKDLVKQKLVAQQAVDDLTAQVDQALGNVRVDEAAIENANLQLNYATIKSPIDGIAGLRQVDAGNIVHAADTTGLVILTQLNPIAVIFTLPEDDLTRVAKAKAAGDVVIAAWSRDGKQILGSGKLAVIDNQINTSSATLKLKAVFDNDEGKLWPNQFVKARLLLRVDKNDLVVPAVAVQQGPAGPYLFTVQDDQTVGQTLVTLGVSAGEYTVVQGKDLKAGMQVIVEGQNQVRLGTKVQARPSGQGPGSAPASQPKSPGASSAAGQAPEGGPHGGAARASSAAGSSGAPAAGLGAGTASDPSASEPTSHPTSQPASHHRSAP